MTEIQYDRNEWRHREDNGRSKVLHEDHEVCPMITNFITKKS